MWMNLLGAPSDLSILFAMIFLDGITYFAVLIVFLNFRVFSSFVILVVTSFIIPTTFLAMYIFLNGFGWAPALNWMSICLALGCFMQTYPSFEGQTSNPTVIILFEIRKRPGITKEQMIQHFKRKKIETGLNKLQSDKFVSISPCGQVSLTLLGKMLAVLFYAYRRLLLETRQNG